MLKYNGRVSCGRQIAINLDHIRNRLSGQLHFIVHLPHQLNEQLISTSDLPDELFVQIRLNGISANNFSRQFNLIDSIQTTLS